MAQNVVHSRKSIDFLYRTLDALLAAMNGVGSLYLKEAREIQIAMGMSALGLIKVAFITKAGGGTDEAGVSWPPLSPRTIAYSRPHPGLPKLKAKGPHSGRPLLSQAQDELWRGLYARVLRRTGSTEIAARVAWSVVKKGGGKTILGEYGNTKVEILRDTGTLLNSLSPGINNQPSGHPNQIVRTIPGGVVIGTNRVGASAHHHGNSAKGLPQRMLWPPPEKWPSTWWNEILLTGRDMLAAIITERMS